MRTGERLRRWRSLREEKANRRASRRNASPVHGGGAARNSKLGARHVKAVKRLLRSTQRTSARGSLVDAYAEVPDDTPLQEIVERLLTLRELDTDVAAAGSERIAQSKERLPAAKVQLAQAGAAFECACVEHRDLSMRIRELKLRLAKMRRSQKAQARSRRQELADELRDMAERQIRGLPPRPLPLRRRLTPSP